MHPKCGTLIELGKFHTKIEKIKLKSKNFYDMPSLFMDYFIDITKINERALLSTNIKSLLDNENVRNLTSSFVFRR